jgi:hypothetical protein
MSATTYTLLEVINIAGFRVGNFKDEIDSLEDPDPPTKYMIECVNAVMRTLAMVKPLPWMNGRAVITTVDDYSTGTVDITNGATTVAGGDSAPVWTAGMVGRAFTTNDRNSLYRIGSFTSATSIEIEEAWSEDTVDEGSYVIAQDRYDLPTDFDDLITASLEGPTTRRLNIITPSEMDRQRHTMRGKVLTTGAPTYISVYDIASSGVRQIELDPFPDDEYRIAIKYKKIPTRLLNDNSTIPIFDKNIDTLIDGVEARWRAAKPTGPEDKAAWEIWKKTALPMYLAFDREKTDEVARLVPDDVTRGQVPMSGPIDWGNR